MTGGKALIGAINRGEVIDNCNTLTRLQMGAKCTVIKNNFSFL